MTFLPLFCLVLVVLFGAAGTAAITFAVENKRLRAKLDPLLEQERYEYLQTQGAAFLEKEVWMGEEGTEAKQAYDRVFDPAVNYKGGAATRPLSYGANCDLQAGIEVDPATLLEARTTPLKGSYQITRRKNQEDSTDLGGVTLNPNAVSPESKSQA